MRAWECIQFGIGCPTAFWISGGFKDAEAALAEIKKKREEKENLIKGIASLAYAFEGSLDYETLKGYPQRELDILTETVENINKQRQASIDKAKRGNSPGGFNPNDTIGFPWPTIWFMIS